MPPPSSTFSWSPPPPSRGRGIAAVVCAFSAGVHAALVPEHLHEAPRLGVAFAAASALLFGLAVALLWRRTSVWPLVGSALLLGTLIVGYALSRTSGIAPLGAEREPLDALGLATKVVELVGVVVAASCVPARSGRPRTSDRADVRPASPASLIRPEENPTYEEVR